MTGIRDQKKLQLAAILLLLLAVVSLEWISLEPVGVYVTDQPGGRPFAVGTTREAVLDRVNDTKSIRELLTCTPDSRTILTSRRGFSLSPEMAASRAWVLMDRQKGVYWLGFTQDALDRVLLLNDPEKEGQAPFLSLVCLPEFLDDPAGVLSSRTGYQVYSSGTPGR